jgi:hypothetical protein
MAQINKVWLFIKFTFEQSRGKLFLVQECSLKLVKLDGIL